MDLPLQDGEIATSNLPRLPERFTGGCITLRYVRYGRLRLFIVKADYADHSQTPIAVYA